MSKFLDSLEWYDSTGKLQGVEKDIVQLGASATASGIYAIALGEGATANTTYATAIGRSATASSEGAVAIGGALSNVSVNGVLTNFNSASASGAGAIALGSAAASDAGAIAIGSATAPGEGAIAIGRGAKSSGGAVAIGDAATVSSGFSVALGYSATASGLIAVAIGHGATASGKNSTAIGKGATVSADNTIVLGNADIEYLECAVQTISQLSDSRVKEDVSLANTAQCLEDVNRLPVSRFKYKDFTGTHLDVHRTGFMADDVEKVFPKAVAKFDRTFPVLDDEGNKVYEQEVDEKGNPVYEQAVDESGVALFNEDGSIKYDEAKPVMKEKTFVMEDVKSVAMEMAIPTLWGAVQELTKRLEAAEAKIEELSK